MNRRLAPILGLCAGLVFLGASCGSSGAIADGGMFTSIDTGETWMQKVFIGRQKNRPITISNSDIQMIIAEPGMPNVLYIGTKADGIYKTWDAGEHWKKIPGVSGRVRDIEIDEQYPNNLYTLKGKTIIKSTDYGENWDEIYTDPQGGTITQIEVDWFDQQRIFATTSKGSILLSEDEGLNWRVIQKVNKPFISLLMDPVDSRVLYAIENEKSLLKSIDGGATWEDLFDQEFKELYPGYNRIRQLSMDPNNNSILYIVSPEGILRSFDAGDTWEYIDTLIERGAGNNGAIRNITIQPYDSDTILFTVGKYIHKSIDGGATWKTIENFPSNRRITAMLVNPAEPDMIYAGVEIVEEESGGLFGGPK